mmetsp:Transcript_30576/g.33397  ORF Transcript_30576/g.33397 Transcript_30576/m.33397 type:complete len:317 (+) Transcript_30576:139-1089(+)|eukprot:CAMPEP_0173163990 /NCGR_PEP_ID=MMETSP1105-20130129/20261_1 /TAXON_ID=2985 /ORGANISM="Ochromonas sp., Strain BG-1" /LENGTH=316 /DNA_ID=CAMNT_0014084175 /DNA_START=74 /DNA_END=1024 /DNA_ORIENTATION=+
MIAAILLIIGYFSVVDGFLGNGGLSRSSARIDFVSFASDDNVNAFAKPTTLTSPDSSSPAAPAVVPTPPVQEIVNLDAVSSKPPPEFHSFAPKSDLTNLYVKTERKAPRQAGWFPMLLSPPSLDGSLAGDAGFDPLGFGAKDKESLLNMREAEIKHARLAMLASIGWPASELYHRQIANALGLQSILASEDKAPSVLNGGLVNQWIIGAGVASLVLGAVLEFSTFQRQKTPGYKPGALGFDPLNLYTMRSRFGLDVITEKLTREEKEEKARFEMETSEIKHGRAAMLAITAFALQEFISGIPVVEQTPFFFGDPIL